MGEQDSERRFSRLLNETWVSCQLNLKIRVTPICHFNPFSRCHHGNLCMGVGLFDAWGDTQVCEVTANSHKSVSAYSSAPRAPYNDTYSHLVREWLSQHIQWNKQTTAKKHYRLILQQATQRRRGIKAHFIPETLSQYTTFVSAGNSFCPSVIWRLLHATFQMIIWFSLCSFPLRGASLRLRVSLNLYAN